MKIGNKVSINLGILIHNDVDVILLPINKLVEINW